MLTRYLTFDLETRLPTILQQPSDSGSVIEGSDETSITVALPVDNIDDASLIFNTYHWLGSSIGKHIERANTDQVWDAINYQYIYPITHMDLITQRAVDEVAILAQNKILQVYPFYRQHNLGRDPTSSEAIEMYAFIDGIRDSSNIAEASILAALTIEEIESIVNAFKLI